MGKSTKDCRDVYYRKAKEEAFRARSAYKLLQINSEFSLFGPHIRRVVDLCAAPGSWSQVVASQLAGMPDALIVAVDLQEMAPIKGVIQLQGDIATQQTAEQILSYFRTGGDAGSKADLVICDGAPDVTGDHDTDEQLQMQLIMAALRTACNLLGEGGNFVTKIFRGPNVQWLNAQLLTLFDTVRLVKPESSREASIEHFAVCQGLKK